MGGRESTDAWCRALVTGRARGRAEGREARRCEEARGAWGPGVWVVPCSRAVQHEEIWNGRHRSGVAVGSSASMGPNHERRSAGELERIGIVVWVCRLMLLMIANLKVAAIQPESVDGSCPMTPPQTARTP